MIDTLHLWIPSTSIEGYDIQKIKPKLYKMKEFKSERGYGFDGNFKNLRVSVFDSGISIKGSLPGFWAGHNLKALEFNEMKPAIEKISHSFDNLPIWDAALSRIDLAMTIETENKPIHYFPFLGHVPNMERSITNSSSVYWQQKNRMRTMLFYDKVAEIKNKKTLLPFVSLKGKNLSRFETRYLGKSSIKKRFKQDLTVNDLCKHETYESMVRIWEEDFNSINKIDPNSINFENVKTPNDFCKEIQNYGFRVLGYDAVNQNLRLLKEQGTFNSVAVSRLRTTTKKAYIQSNNLTMIDELNKKVRLIVRTQNDRTGKGGGG